MKIIKLFLLSCLSWESFGKISREGVGMSHTAKLNNLPPSNDVQFVCHPEYIPIKSTPTIDLNSSLNTKDSSMNTTLADGNLDFVNSDGKQILDTTTPGAVNSTLQQVMRASAETIKTVTNTTGYHDGVYEHKEHHGISSDNVVRYLSKKGDGLQSNESGGIQSNKNEGSHPNNYDRKKREAQNTHNSFGGVTSNNDGGIQNNNLAGHQTNRFGFVCQHCNFVVHPGNKLHDELYEELVTNQYTGPPSYEVRLWYKEGIQRACNYDVVDNGASLDEYACQTLCEAKSPSECVGYSFDAEIPDECLLCPNDTLHYDAHSSFYRRPGNI